MFDLTNIKKWLAWCESDEYAQIWSESSIQHHKDVAALIKEVEILRGRVKCQKELLDQWVDDFGKIILIAKGKL